jgi:hypothetical protein
MKSGKRSMLLQIHHSIAPGSIIPVFRHADIPVPGYLPSLKSSIPKQYLYQLFLKIIALLASASQGSIFH